VVGDGKRSHAEFGRLVNKRTDSRRAVKKTVFGMDVKMNKTVCHYEAPFVARSEARLP
jgi:hypothetical protein